MRITAAQFPTTNVCSCSTGSGFLGLGPKKTKFGLIVEASAGLGKIIKEIADGAITWNQLPEKFDANKAAMNIWVQIFMWSYAFISLK